MDRKDFKANDNIKHNRSRKVKTPTAKMQHRAEVALLKIINQHSDEVRDIKCTWIYDGTDDKIPPSTFTEGGPYPNGVSDVLKYLKMFFRRCYRNYIHEKWNDWSIPDYSEVNYKSFWLRRRGLIEDLLVFHLTVDKEKYIDNLLSTELVVWLFDPDYLEEVFDPVFRLLLPFTKDCSPEFIKQQKEELAFHIWSDLRKWSREGFCRDRKTYYRCRIEEQIRHVRFSREFK